MKMEKQVGISKENFKHSNYERYVIVGDVGGTNSHLAVMGARNGKQYDLIFKMSEPTHAITAFDDYLNNVLKEAKEEYNISISLACIGAAGPISRKRRYVKMTNVDLELNVSDLVKKTMLNKIILLNDFEAIGYGLDLMDLNKDVVELKHLGKDLTEGRTTMNTFAVIGAGAGLGMSIAPYSGVNQKHLHVPSPSEGGHIDFSPQNELEWEMVKYLKENVLTDKDAFPELESVLSAKGMGNIFDFLVSKLDNKNDIIQRVMALEGVEKLREMEDNYENDETCKKTIDLFFVFYARGARYLGLISEAFSGLFITGKIARKHIEKLKNDEFMKEFELHDKKSEILRKMPVYVITNVDVGLYGCCNVAINFFNL